MQTFIRRNPLFALVLVASVTLIIAFTYVNKNSGSYIINPLEFNSDTDSYLATIEYFRSALSGNSEVPNQEILTRTLTTPLMTLLSMCIGWISGSDAFGIIIVNVALYFLLVPVLYFTGLQLFQDKKAACIATVLVITNWVLFTFGTTFLVDIGGWFFFLLSTMFAFMYFKNPSRDTYFYYAIISSIVGVFFKEYGALGMITLGLLTCFAAISRAEKIKKLLIAGVLFGAVLISYHLWFYLHFNYSYFGWYDFNYTEYAAPESLGNKHDFSHLIRVVALIFLPGWPLFLLGVRRFIQERRHPETMQKMIMLGASLPASLAFLAWPAFTHRISFILIPWIALVTAFGLAKLRYAWIIILLVLYVLFNINVDVLTATISIP